MSIEERIKDYNQRIYQGTMTAHQKEVLRDVWEKEDTFWELEGRDYVYGHDEGHPPMGAKW